jgi:hypothetical protein
MAKKMSATVRFMRPLIVAVIWLGMFYSNASAHGGIAGPDELGPPVITAAALGIAGYWTVMLWPSRRNFRPRSKGPRRSDTRFIRRANTRF